MAEPTHEVTGDEAAPAGPSRFLSLATPAHYLSLPVAFAVILYMDHRLWFYGDEWDLLAVRGTGGRPLQLFAPHNEHWSTIPLLIFRGLYGLVGIRSYLPYLAVLLAAHIVLAHLIWRWLMRLNIHPWVATSLTGVFLVLGSGGSDLIRGFQVAWVLTLIFGLLGLFLVDHAGAGSRRDLAFWPLAVASLMCSGIGVTMVVLAATVALLRRGWSAALRVASVPAVVYLTWLGLIGRQNIATTPAAKAQLLLIPQYIWTGLTKSLDNTTGWAGAGAVLIIALAVFLYRERRLAITRLASVFAAAIVAVVFFAINGVGRIALGIDQAASQRYAYICIALLLPATAWALTRLAARTQGGLVLGMVLCGLVATNGLGTLNSTVLTALALEEPARDQILAVARLIHAGAPLAVPDDTPLDTLHAPNLTITELRDMLRDGAVPIGTAVPAEAVLHASTLVQVSVTTSPFVAAAGATPTIDSDANVTVGADKDGCLSVVSRGAGSRLNVRYSAPASIAITPDTDGEVGTSIARVEAPQVLSEPRVFSVTGGSTVYLNVTAVDTIPRIFLPAGTSVICGLSP